MEPEPAVSQTTPTAARRWNVRKRVAIPLGALLAAYLAAAYLVLPWAWKREVRRHPGLESIPGITHTRDGTPGDPLNVALIGAEAEVKKILLAAKWYPADPLTLRSCLAIAADTVLKRAYEGAPVSNLYLFGRREDLAFEQPVGDSPRQRHHVRFWRSEELDSDGRAVWVGAATYDRKVGLSERTGQITHHIAPDVDTERDHLMDSLRETGGLSEDYVLSAFHKTLQGRNGGGDPWHTDGNLRVGVIAAGKAPQALP